MKSLQTFAEQIPTLGQLERRDESVTSPLLGQMGASSCAVAEAMISRQFLLQSLATVSSYGAVVLSVRNVLR